LQGKWKLVSRYPDRWELYDFDADRSEMTNLIDANAALANRMIARFWITPYIPPHHPAM
jgi:arylsulfatase